MKNDKRIKTRCAFSMWIKTVACVLSILIMLYAVPANVFAELIDVIDATLENQANEDTIENALEKERIRENNYNLLPSLYVEKIRYSIRSISDIDADIRKVLREIKELLE